MARLGRNIFLALAAGAAGGAVANLLSRKDGDLRPVAKTAVRAGLSLFDRVRGAAGEAAEKMSDLVAEVQNEMQEGQHRDSDHVVPFEAKSFDDERRAHG